MNARTPFSFGASFVTRDRVPLGGKWIDAGAPFPWRELGLTERDIWMLWRTFVVDCLPEPSATSPASGAEPPSPEPTAPLELTPSQPASAAPPRMGKRGRRRWAVNTGG